MVQSNQDGVDEEGAEKEGQRGEAKTESVKGKSSRRGISLDNGQLDYQDDLTCLGWDYAGSSRGGMLEVDSNTLESRSTNARVDFQADHEWGIGYFGSLLADMLLDVSYPNRVYGI